MLVKKLLLLVLFINLVPCIANKDKQEENEQTAIEFSTEQEEKFNKHFLSIIANNWPIFLTASSSNEELASLIREHAHFFKSKPADVSDLDPQIYQICKKNLPKQKSINEYIVAKTLLKTLRLNKTYEIFTFQINDRAYFKKGDEWYYIKHNKEKMILPSKLEAIIPQTSNITLHPITNTKPVKKTDDDVMKWFAWITTIFIVRHIWPRVVKSGEEEFFLEGTFSYKIKTVTTGGFQNLGNTCYANATNQALRLWDPRFFQERKERCKLSNFKDDADKIPLCDAYINLFNARDKKNIHTKDLLRVYKELEKCPEVGSSEIWLHTGQSDAPEYLDAVLGFFRERGETTYDPNAIFPFLVAYDKLRCNIDIPFSKSSMEKLKSEAIGGRQHSNILQLAIPKQKLPVTMQELVDQGIVTGEHVVKQHDSLSSFSQEYESQLSQKDENTIVESLFAKMFVGENGFWKDLIKKKLEFGNKKQFKNAYEKKKPQELLNLKEKDFDKLKKVIRKKNGQLPIDSLHFEAFKMAISYMGKYFEENKNKNVEDELKRLADDQIIINALEPIKNKVNLSKVIPSLFVYSNDHKVHFYYTFKEALKNLEIKGDKLIIQLKRFHDPKKRIKTLVDGAENITACNKEFKLKSVVHQRGTLYGGHYIAYGEEGDYYCYNDERVFKVEEKTYKRGVQEGYLFFYNLAT